MSEIEKQLETLLRFWPGISEEVKHGLIRSVFIDDVSLFNFPDWLEAMLRESFGQIVKIEAENKLLRRIIYESCSLSDFQRGGFDEALYQSIVDEFEKGSGDE